MYHKEGTTLLTCSAFLNNEAYVQEARDFLTLKRNCMGNDRRSLYIFSRYYFGDCIFNQDYNYVISQVLVAVTSAFHLQHDPNVIRQVCTVSGTRDRYNI